MQWFFMCLPVERDDGKGLGDKILIYSLFRSYFRLLLKGLDLDSRFRENKTLFFKMRYHEG